MSDKDIEQQIKAKGLTAPRVTPGDVERNIKSEFYFTAGEGVLGQSQMGTKPAGRADSLNRLTFCVLVLDNGFTVTGESACVSAANFDAEIGKKVARTNAVAKIWPLMGYELTQRLHVERSDVWENEDDCRRALADTDKTSHFESVARIAHEVNRAYCQSIGDDSQPAWEDAPEWQRESAINGVAFHLKNDATPEQSHANWLEQKAREGWKYGPVKDVEKKEHPCFCSYGELPAEQRAKDYLFRGVVNSFK
ncbi:TPA: hypothetical protein MDH17_000108 [Klebsiella pneumoniae]|jgi:hypothetical protein|nr:RyR domain [Klebsiella pneumoniae]VGA16644.1 RyR domain [Klebsiella pneumoniae]VGC91482.1 RyR domain [Klebsiella pneumoniae]HBU9358026.1 hypothetical protein [Klebsiella pneumoniae]